MHPGHFPPLGESVSLSRTHRARRFARLPKHSPPTKATLLDLVQAVPAWGIGRPIRGARYAEVCMGYRRLFSAPFSIRAACHTGPSFCSLVGGIAMPQVKKPHRLGRENPTLVTDGSREGRFARQKAGLGNASAFCYLECYLRGWKRKRA